MPKQLRLLLAIVLLIFCNFGFATGTGTGFAILNGNYYVTNYHVVKGAKAICLRLDSGEVHPARVVNFDASDDLALLQAKHTSPPLVLAPFGQAKRGMRVLAIGFPDPSILGFESKATEGIISALSGFRGDTSLMQISSPIQPGNSGGPLISEYGNVVGIVVSKLSLEHVKSSGYVADNVGYAVNSAKLQGLLETTRNIEIELVSRRQVSIQPLSTVQLVSMSERSVVMILSFSENVVCEGHISDFALLDLDESTRNSSEIRERTEEPRTTEPSQGNSAQESENRIRAEEERKKKELEEQQLARARAEEERKKKELEEQQLAKVRAEEERKKKELEERQLAQTFNNGLAAVDGRWERIIDSPGFKKWTSMDEPTIAEIFGNHEDPVTANQLLRSYLDFVTKTYNKKDGGDLSDLNVFLGGIDLDYVTLGQISEVNLSFRYFVANINQNVSSSDRIWFYSSDSNEWVSLDISKVGSGWMSVSVPADMNMPRTNTSIFRKR